MQYTLKRVRVHIKEEKEMTKNVAKKGIIKRRGWNEQIK
jgi:hypothetical protein